jgi:hypothetical protein
VVTQRTIQKNLPPIVSLVVNVLNANSTLVESSRMVHLTLRATNALDKRNQNLVLSSKSFKRCWMKKLQLFDNVNAKMNFFKLN